MPYQLKIPARVNILGNPADANEGDFATISAAIDLHAYAVIEDAEGLIFQQLERTTAGKKILVQEKYSRSQIPLPYKNKLDLLKGAVNRLWKYSPEFQEKLSTAGFKISTWTEVPRQSGLGGSTLFVLLTLCGLRAQYNLDPHQHNDYVLAEITQRVEAKELGITCGFADRYVPLFGGIAYLDYRGKLHHKAINEEPFVTYERLDPWVESLPLIIASSGVKRNSGDVHGQMRPRYIKEHDHWKENGGDMPPLVRFMSAAWDTAWLGKIALLKDDWETFGHLMNENHRWVDEMMTYCGFDDGAGSPNNLLIEVALKNGALGAKLTGAGGGGSVFALPARGKEDELVAAWEKAIADSNFKNAQIHRTQIDREGLVIQEV